MSPQAPLPADPPKPPTITPHLLLSVLGFVVTQIVAFGILDSGTGQTIVAIGGIVIPAAFSIAAALHLGRVHSAQIAAGQKPTRL